MNRDGDLDLIDAQPEDSSAIFCVFSFTSGFGKRENRKRKFKIKVFSPAREGFDISFYMIHGVKGGVSGGVGGGGGAGDEEGGGGEQAAARGAAATAATGKCDKVMVQRREQWIKELVNIS